MVMFGYYLVYEMDMDFFYLHVCDPCSQNKINISAYSLRGRVVLGSQDVERNAPDQSEGV